MPPPNLHQLAYQELCPRVLPVPMQEIQHMTGDKFKGSLISKKNHFGSNLQKKGDISLSEHFFFFMCSGYSSNRTSFMHDP